LALTLLVRYCGGLLALRRLLVIVVAIYRYAVRKFHEKSFLNVLRHRADRRCDEQNIGRTQWAIKGLMPPTLQKLHLTADAEYAANLVKCQYVVVKVQQCSLCHTCTTTFFLLYRKI